jgi:hypothetical protein
MQYANSIYDSSCFIHHNVDLVSIDRNRNAGNWFYEFIESNLYRAPKWFKWVSLGTLAIYPTPHESFVTLTHILQILSDKRLSQENTNNEVMQYHHKHIRAIAKTLTLSVSMLCLMTPIFILTLANISNAVSLAVIVIFVLLFAINLVFTDTSVETVFIGTCT